MSSQTRRAKTRSDTVRPGLTYFDYVRKELPHEALRESPEGGAEGPTTPSGEPTSRLSIVGYAQRFSKLFYDRDYMLRLPDMASLPRVAPATARRARALIDYALSVRDGHVGAHEDASKLIRSYLGEQADC